MTFAPKLFFMPVTVKTSFAPPSFALNEKFIAASFSSGVSIVAAGALRGTGDTFVPSIMNLCSIWIVRLGLALVLVPRMGLRGMWIAMAIELCVRGLLMLFRQLTTKYYEKYKKEPV